MNTDDLLKQPIVDETGLLCDIPQLRQLVHDMALIVGELVAEGHVNPARKYHLVSLAVILHNFTCTEEKKSSGGIPTNQEQKRGHVWNSLSHALQAAPRPANPHLS